MRSATAARALRRVEGDQRLDRVLVLVVVLDQLRAERLRQLRAVAIERVRFQA